MYKWFSYKIKKIIKNFFIILFCCPISFYKTIVFYIKNLYKIKLSEIHIIFIVKLFEFLYGGYYHNIQITKNFSLFQISKIRENSPFNLSNAHQK